MAKHPFHRELADLRRSSRWPDREEFAYQVGLSLGGYRKIEDGSRIPSMGVLQRILKKVGVKPEIASRFIELWNDVKAQQMGIKRHSGQTPTVDLDSLAKRIQSEIVYSVLRRANIRVDDNTQRVMAKRIAMILKATLGG